MCLNATFSRFRSFFWKQGREETNFIFEFVKGSRAGGLALRIFLLSLFSRR